LPFNSCPLLTDNLREQLRIASKQASTLSQEAFKAYREENAKLSRTLIEDAAMAGKKSQVLLYEIQKAKANG
jgi:RNase P subunit RPR2